MKPHKPPNIVYLSGEHQPLRVDATDRRFWVVDASASEAAATAPAPAEAATELGAQPGTPRQPRRARMAGWALSPSGGLALLLISAICMGAGFWHLAARLWHVGV